MPIKGHWKQHLRAFWVAQGSLGLLQGEALEARFEGRGKYFRGVCSAVNKDGSVDVIFDAAM